MSRQYIKRFNLRSLTGPVVGGVVSVALLTIGFVALGDHVVEDGQDGFDHRLSLALHDRASPGLTKVMRFATDLGSAPVTVPLMILLLTWLLIRKERVLAAVVATAWIGAQVLDVVLKTLYQRDRPSLFPVFAKAGGYSFPSGHTVTALVTYGLFTGVVWYWLTGWWRWVLVGTAVIIVAFVATSRVYLGVHYPSDVLGAVLIGSAWLGAWLLVIARVRNGGWTADGSHADTASVRSI